MKALSDLLVLSMKSYHPPVLNATRDKFTKFCEISIESFIFNVGCNRIKRFQFFLFLNWNSQNQSQPGIKLRGTNFFPWTKGKKCHLWVT